MTVKTRKFFIYQQPQLVHPSKLRPVTRVFRRYSKPLFQVLRNDLLSCGIKTTQGFFLARLDGIGLLHYFTSPHVLASPKPIPELEPYLIGSPQEKER